MTNRFDVVEELLRHGVSGAAGDRDPSCVDGLDAGAAIKRAPPSAVPVCCLPLWLWLLAQSSRAQRDEASGGGVFDVVDDVPFLVRGEHPNLARSARPSCKEARLG